MYYIFIVNVICYSTKTENFANELTFLNFLQGLNLAVRHLSHKIPGISSHLLYPNIMIDVLIIYD